MGRLRGSHRRHWPLSIEQKWELQIGPGFVDPAFGSDAERRQAWEANREALVAEAIEREAGTRPWAWWHYEAGREQYLDECGPGDPDIGTRLDDREAESIRFVAQLGELTADERRRLLYAGREAARRIGTGRELCTVDGQVTYGPDRCAAKVAEAIGDG